MVPIRSTSRSRRSSEARQYAQTASREVAETNVTVAPHPGHATSRAGASLTTLSEARSGLRGAAFRAELARTLQTRLAACARDRRLGRRRRAGLRGLPDRLPHRLPHRHA